MVNEEASAGTDSNEAAVKSTSEAGGLPNDVAIATGSPQSANSPQPPAEMQSLAIAFEGRWAIRAQFEPDEWTPNGGVANGEEVWRRGPGGFTFMEEAHYSGADTEIGLALSWWDKDKGLQGLWCEYHNPQGCDLQGAVSGFGPKWDGKQLVVDTEFPRNGKKFVWHEVFSDITATSFTQTADIGEKGGPLKRWLTIHATRVADSVTSSQKMDAAFRGFWTLNVEKSDFGDRPKPKTGFVNWGEHGWTIAIVQADGPVYADAVETSEGCAFIGMAPSDLSCTVEVVTPRHVRLTIRQGTSIRRIGDIELLEDGTTRTTHQVTPPQGAPYMEKTIWEKRGSRCGSEN
jgi:hypothetical protein